MLLRRSPSLLLASRPSPTCLPPASHLPLSLRPPACHLLPTWLLQSPGLNPAAPPPAIPCRLPLTLTLQPCHPPLPRSSAPRHYLAGLTHDARWLQLPPALTPQLRLPPLTPQLRPRLHPAGLTHDARWLQLPAVARSPDGLAALVSEPGDPEELVSIQAAWNASLFLRHDLYHAHVSEIEDGGDGIDATFRLVRGCTVRPDLAQPRPEAQGV